MSNSNSLIALYIACIFPFSMACSTVPEAVPSSVECDQGEASLTGSVDPMPSVDGQADTTGDEVLALINGQPITLSLFQQAAQRKRPANGSELSEREKEEVLDKLVDDALLYQLARMRGLHESEKVQKVMVQALLRDDVYGTIKSSDIDDASMEAYFADHYEEFVVPAKAQIRRILIRVGKDRSEDAALAEATRLYREIDGDASRFKALAGEFSEDQYRKRAGEVGFVTEAGKPGLDQDVVDHAFMMEPGELSEPFRSKDGYNLVYLVNKRDRIERDFKKMKGAVLRKLKQELLLQTYEQYIEELRGRSSIEIDEAAVAGVEIKGRSRPVGTGIGSAPVVPGGDSHAGDSHALPSSGHLDDSLPQDDGLDVLQGSGGD